MGTNYYLHHPPKNKCEHCGREDQEEPLHIGKSSAGWVFALHIIPEMGVNDLEDWLPLFRRGTIKNEYGDTLTDDDMVTIILRRFGLRDFDDPARQAAMKATHLSEEAFHHSNGSMRGPNNLLRSKLSKFCVKHGEGTWDCLVGDFS